MVDAARDWDLLRTLVCGCNEEGCVRRAIVDRVEARVTWAESFIASREVQRRQVLRDGGALSRAYVAGQADGLGEALAILREKLNS